MTSTQTPDPDLLSISEMPMPRLSDDAVVQIHDFIHHVLDLFEARYGDQIHRFYEDLCSDSMIETDTTRTGTDPPF
jgi:hypothetical protein